jgi:hypothetical protein
MAVNSHRSRRVADLGEHRAVMGLVAEIDRGRSHFGAPNVEGHALLRKAGDLLLRNCDRDGPGIRAAQRSIPGTVPRAAVRSPTRMRGNKAGLGGRDIGSAARPNQPARYLHCVFAYDTDLSKHTWIDQEAGRFRQQQKGDEHLIDWVYVLNRGVLNMNGNRGRLEDDRSRNHNILLYSFEFH